MISQIKARQKGLAST